MNNKGLTLIELLAVISIVIIMSGILMFNTDDSGGTIDIVNQVSSIKQDIYGAREKTLSGVGREQANDDYGIGLYFDTNLTNGSYYIVYLNVNGSGKEYNSGTDTILKKVYMENGLRYDTGNYTQMIYMPPTAKTYICSGSDCLGTSLSITVEKITDPSKNSTITVNSAGIIE